MCNRDAAMCVALVALNSLLFPSFLPSPPPPPSAPHVPCSLAKGARAGDPACGLGICCFHADRRVGLNGGRLQASASSRSAFCSRLGDRWCDLFAAAATRSRPTLLNMANFCSLMWPTVTKGWHMYVFPTPYDARRANSSQQLRIQLVLLCDRPHLHGADACTRRSSLQVRQRYLYTSKTEVHVYALPPHQLPARKHRAQAHVRSFYTCKLRSAAQLLICWLHCLHR